MLRKYIIVNHIYKDKFIKFSDGSIIYLSNKYKIVIVTKVISSRLTVFNKETYVLLNSKVYKFQVTKYTHKYNNKSNQYSMNIEVDGAKVINIDFNNKLLMTDIEGRLSANIIMDYSKQQMSVGVSNGNKVFIYDVNDEILSLSLK